MNPRLRIWLLLISLTCLWQIGFAQYFKRVDSYSEGLAIVQKYDPVVQSYINQFGYVDEYNKLVIPMKYGHAEQFRDGAAIVGIGVKYGLINKSGKVILPIQYDDVRHEKNLGVYSFKDSKKNIGVIHPSGKIIVPCKYWSVDLDTETLTGQNLLIGKQGSFKKDDITCCIYDMNGKALLPDGYYLAYEFDKDFEEFNPVYNINSAEKIKEHAATKKNGCCIVVKDGKYGAYDLNEQRMILNAIYDYVGIFKNCFLTHKDGFYGLTKTDGTEIYPNIFVSPRISPNLLFLFGEDDEFGVYDIKNQKEVLPLYCKKIDGWDEVVLCKGKYRFWNENAENYLQDGFLYDTIIPINSAFVFSYKMSTGYIVKRNGKYGLKNAMLEELLPFEYDMMEFDSNKSLRENGSYGMIHCKKGDMWGIYSSNNMDNLVDMSELVSDAKMQVSNGFLIAQDKGKFGFYVTNGKIKFQYDAIPITLGRDRWMVEKDGKKGLVTLYDKNGCEKAFHDHIEMEPNGEFCENLEPIYDTIIMLYDEKGKALTKKNEHYGYVIIPYGDDRLTPINIPYEEVLYCGNCQIEKPSSARAKQTGKKEYYWVEVFSVLQNGKWGYIGIEDDYNIIVISKPIYDEVGKFEYKNGQTKALVRKGKKYYYIDTHGKKTE